MAKNHNIQNLLTEIYHNNLMSNEKLPPALKTYLLHRGLLLDTIKKFQVGYAYCNVGFNTLANKFPISELLDSGLIKQNEDKSYRDFFYGRIVFPVIHNGNTEYFSSRLFPEVEDRPKHLHQSGHCDEAFNHDVLDNSETIFITEGPFDCMTLDQCSYPAIGLLGAGRISKKIIAGLMDKKIYIVFDYDPNESGQKAALRLAKKLMGYNIPSHIVKLPTSDGKIDVNSFFFEHWHSQDRFDELVSQAELYDIKPTLINRQNESAKDLPPIMKAAEKYLKGRMIGSNYTARCIFHKEKTGSLVIYPSTNTMHCFGCGKTGSTLDIIVQGERNLGNNISFKQAKELAEQL